MKMVKLASHKHKFLLLLLVASTLAFTKSNWKGKLVGEHPEMVNAISVSPDGAWFASASNDNKVKIWKSDDNGLVKEITCHSVAVTDVVFTSDRSLMITSGKDYLVRFWDTKTWKMVAEGKEHTSMVNALALSSDDAYLYTAGDDNRVLQWNVQKRQFKREIGQHNDRVLSLSLSSDDKYLVSTSGNKLEKSSGNLKIWELSNHSCIYTLQTPMYSVEDACFNAKGSLVAYAGNFPSIYYINTKGEQLASQEISKYGVNAIALRGVSLYAGSNFDGKVYVWELGKEVESFKAHHENIFSVRLLSRDILSGGSDGKVKRWKRKE